MSRLPVLLIDPAHREAWETLLWEQGLEPIASDTLPDPVAEPEAARAALTSLAAGHRGPVTDPLMGLVRRREALQELEEEAAVVDPEPLWLALLNVDNFRAINSNFGLDVGDRVLAEVGRLVREHAASARVLGRLGGDSVLAAFRGAGDEVRASLTSLASALRGSSFSQQFVLTVSIGLARHRPGEDIDDLIDRADRNLFAAKNQGRDRIVDEGEFHESAAETDLEAELADFENRVRVFADRLIAGLTGRGRRLVETYRDEADHDGLTGLFHRRYFDRRLVREVQRARKLNSPLTVILVDLDEFASFNRRLGYPAGDEALKAAAQVVLRGVRVVDWTARSGGQEFCAVLPDTESDIAEVVAERMRRALADLALENDAHLTASLGVVSLAPGDAGVPALLERAHRAVLASKEAGRNRVTLLGVGR